MVIVKITRKWGQGQTESDYVYIEEHNYSRPLDIDAEVHRWCSDNFKISYHYTIIDQVVLSDATEINYALNKRIFKIDTDIEQLKKERQTFVDNLIQIKDESN